MIKPNNDGRIGGGTKSIGEDDGWDARWPDGDGKTDDIKPGV